LSADRSGFGEFFFRLGTSTAWRRFFGSNSL
jgi:hypothetical protein